MSSPTKLVFLGGLGEFGMNFLVIETEEAALIVDCGFQFPDAEHLGIDVLIPDFAYLETISRKKKMALAITHAHEDHVGAVPFLLQRWAMPVYSKLFETREIEKVYLAVVEGVPKSERWSCDLPLAPDSRRPGLMMINKQHDKPASTHFERLATHRCLPRQAMPVPRAFSFEA